MEIRDINHLISNRFEALENLNDSQDINRTWENIKENIKISAKEKVCMSVWTEAA
jgi:hypothetical protein